MIFWEKQVKICFKVWERKVNVCFKVFRELRDKCFRCTLLTHIDQKKLIYFQEFCQYMFFGIPTVWSEYIVRSNQRTVTPVGGRWSNQQQSVVRPVVRRLLDQQQSSNVTGATSSSLRR